MDIAKSELLAACAKLAYFQAAALAKHALKFLLSSVLSRLRPMNTSLFKRVSVGPQGRPIPSALHPKDSSMCTPWKKYLHATEQVTQLFGSQDDCKKIVGLLKPAIADVQAESYSTQNKPDEQQSRGNTQAETFTVLQTCIAQNSNYRQTQHT